MRRIAYRYQRTLARPVDVTGVGFVTGCRIRARFRPAPADTGIVFIRSDRPGSPRTPAVIAAVTDTRRRTTLGPPADGVTLVEHALAALAGLRIDNCTIELDGPELPALDGSALGFVQALTGVGGVLQHARRPVVTPTEPIRVADPTAGACVSFYPGADETLRLTYALDYGPQAAIPRQTATVDLTPDTFTDHLAACRTFVLESEVAGLRAQGLGRHTTTADLLVFGPSGVRTNTLRFADEPARHKLLDLVGDLALSGYALAGHVVAYRSGHGLNAELTRRLVASAAAAAPAARTRPHDGRLGTAA